MVAQEGSLMHAHIIGITSLGAVPTWAYLSETKQSIQKLISAGRSGAGGVQGAITKHEPLLSDPALSHATQA
eukprot:365303-Chlamydomonas_euryale.AAC.9